MQPRVDDPCPVWQAHAVGCKSRAELDALLRQAPEEYRARIQQHLKTFWGVKKHSKKRRATR